MPRAGPAGRGAGGGSNCNGMFLNGQLAVQHRHINLAPQSSARPVKQGGKHPLGQIHTRNDIADTGPHAHGWAAFLAEHRFLVGLSIDGPEALHDRYRRDRGGRPTFAAVMRALELLKTKQEERPVRKHGNIPL